MTLILETELMRAGEVSLPGSTCVPPLWQCSGSSGRQMSRRSLDAGAGTAAGVHVSEFSLVEKDIS